MTTENIFNKNIDELEVVQKYKDLKESAYRNLKLDEERGVNKELIDMKKTHLDEACEKCENSIKNLKEAIDNGKIIKNKIDNLKIGVGYAHAFMILNQEMNMWIINLETAIRNLSMYIAIFEVAFK